MPCMPEAVIKGPGWRQSPCWREGKTSGHVLPSVLKLFRNLVGVFAGDTKMDCIKNEWGSKIQLHETSDWAKIQCVAGRKVIASRPRHYKAGQKKQ